MTTNAAGVPDCFDEALALRRVTQNYRVRNHAKKRRALYTVMFFPRRHTFSSAVRALAGHEKRHFGLGFAPAPVHVLADRKRHVERNKRLTGAELAIKNRRPSFQNQIFDQTFGQWQSVQTSFAETLEKPVRTNICRADVCAFSRIFGLRLGQTSFGILSPRIEQRTRRKCQLLDFVAEFLGIEFHPRE